jgi:hypothetical protein
MVKPSEDVIGRELDHLTGQWGDVKLTKLCEVMKAKHGFDPQSVKNVVWTTAQMFTVDEKGQVTRANASYIDVDATVITVDHTPALLNPKAITGASNV